MLAYIQPGNGIARLADNHLGIYWHVFLSEDTHFYGLCSYFRNCFVNRIREATGPDPPVADFIG